MTNLKTPESSSLPKYVSVYNDLRKGIIAGHYGSDGRLPTEKELMDQFAGTMQMDPDRIRPLLRYML